MALVQNNKNTQPKIKKAKKARRVKPATVTFASGVASNVGVARTGSRASQAVVRTGSRASNAGVVRTGSQNVQIEQ